MFLISRPATIHHPLYIERSSFPNFDPYSSFSEIQLEVSQRIFLCFSSLWHQVLRLFVITSAPSSDVVFHHFGIKF
jgi:hypothetical protein